MKHILVYLDEGVGPSAFYQLYSSLTNLLSSEFLIKAVDRRFFLSSDWEKRCALVVFPGGRDLLYHLALQGDANARIRSFVEKGGRYLGFCAGGYYGASSIEFELGGELEVKGERELCFFPGKAIGPAYGKGEFCYLSEKGAKASRIEWEKGECSIYYNGGCLFENAETFSPAIEVLARYVDLTGRPAAAVYCKVGLGASLLSGIHPEFSFETSSSPFGEQLKPFELDRKSLFEYFIYKILI